ncbi:MAG: radical SAM protein [Acidobacteria bacterium]|nr:radical SAM protein [Acidobacteriota bacterium]
MSEKQYFVNEIFASIQGEGARAGTANVFIRFAACNLACNGEVIDGVLQPVCDTQFTGGRRLTAQQIVAEAAEVGGKCNYVILTGGEPALQIDEELIEALHTAGYQIAIETNGTKPLPKGLDWICVSPKTADHTIQVLDCDEVKFVIGDRQALPKTQIRATHYFLSPAWDADGLKRQTLDWCIGLVRQNPRWRLSLQIHKLLNVR